MSEEELRRAIDETNSFLGELRALKFTDTGHFRQMCREYAQEHGVSVEQATAVLKPICDARERITR